MLNKAVVEQPLLPKEMVEQLNPLRQVLAQPQQVVVEQLVVKVEVVKQLKLLLQVLDQVVAKGVVPQVVEQPLLPKEMVEVVKQS